MTLFPNYCSHCGSELTTRPLEGRKRAYCTHCDRPIYRNAKPCAGILVVDESDVLLVQRTNPPVVGSWSLPAGFLEVDERPADAAVRELTEETGLLISPRSLKLFETNLVEHTIGTSVLVIIYRTDRTATDGTVVAGSDAANAKFWYLRELRDSKASIEPNYESIIRAVLPDHQREVSNS